MPPLSRSSSVLLIHFPSLHNYGTGMMGINLIHHLRLRRPDIRQVTSDFDNESDIAALYNELGESPERLRILRRDYLSLYEKCCQSTKLQKLSFLPGLRQAVLALPLILAGQYRDIVFLGGDGLWEGYYENGEVPLLAFFQKLERYAKLHLVGQTIAPFENPINLLRLQKLRRTKIYARDTIGYNYLIQESRIPKDSVMRSSDLALLPLPRQNDAKLRQELFAQYRLEKDRYVTLVLSGMATFYTNNTADFEECWVRLIRNLLQKPELEGKNICLLTHVFSAYGGKSEREVGRDIFSRLSPAEHERVILIADEVGPTRARLVLGNSLLVVTARMHASISAYQMGVPAVVLSYGPKYKGLIGETLGFKELLIPADQTEQWETGAIVPRIMARVSEVLAEREAWMARIRSSVATESNHVSASLDDLASRLSH